MPGGRNGEVREAKQGKTEPGLRPARVQVARRGGADTDNWEDAMRMLRHPPSVLIAVSRNWVERKPTTQPFLAER